jgi:acyl dehydratase
MRKEQKMKLPLNLPLLMAIYLLSLIPYLWKQIAEVRNVKMEINYGIENFKFGQAVPVDSDVKLQATVKSVTDLRGTIKVVVKQNFL